jgi:hypothetical protein
LCEQPEQPEQSEQPEQPEQPEHKTNRKTARFFILNCGNSHFPNKFWDYQKCVVEDSESLRNGAVSIGK